MSEVACPMDPCDFQGAADSVEAHISAMTDELHKGAIGREFRDLLGGGEVVSEAVESPTGGSSSGSTSAEGSGSGGSALPGDLWFWVGVALLVGAGGYLYLRSRGDGSDQEEEKNDVAGEVEEAADDLGGLVVGGA